jgi:uracil-DNA glycosylase
MIVEIALPAETDFDAWRDQARRLCAEGIAPENVVWTTPERGASLFAANPPENKPSGKVRAPRRFIDLSHRVICHRDPERFARLYRVLWRLQTEPSLLTNAADADIAWLHERDKAIRRDIHKMHAFVRFRLVGEQDGREVYAAWFEPTHRIVALAAPFFMRRFAAMDWAIFTPEESVRWQDGELTFGPGASRDAVPGEDAVEDQWRAYFASIFNPARLKIGAMTAEMPKKYWRNMPETQLIPSLIAESRQRTQTMQAEGVHPPNPRAVHWRPAPDKPAPDAPETLEDARIAVQRCQRCPLYAGASQAVFGEGPRDAALMMVGEQPGDQEDLAGHVFVGPAGQLLDQAMAEAGLDRASIYLTNAVKHFKYTVRGKRRLHQRPSAQEIDHCRWWLDLERAQVRPRLILAMGASAARGVLGRDVPVMKSRGEEFALPDGAHARVTVHPSYLLRLPDADAKIEAYARFVVDLREAARRAEALAA